MRLRSAPNDCGGRARAAKPQWLGGAAGGAAGARLRGGWQCLLQPPWPADRRQPGADGRADSPRAVRGLGATRCVAAARVRARRPSQAKDPYASIRNKLRYDAIETGWVRLGSGELIPRQVALQGLRFRVIPTDEEFAGDMISRVWLIPFASLRQPAPQLEDADGRPIQTKSAHLPGSEGSFTFFSSEAQTLGDWFRRTGFEPGDSVLITITRTAPLTLQLEREPAAAFRADEVAAQEQALIDALATQVARNRSNMLFPDDAVLPAYARAPWRASYPGRPWQLLVAADQRMRLVDGMYLADSSFRRPLDMLFGDQQQQEQRWQEQDRELLAQINAFQAELLVSRRDAALRGIWNGVAPRASTGRMI